MKEKGHLILLGVGVLAVLWYLMRGGSGASSMAVNAAPASPDLTGGGYPNVATSSMGAIQPPTVPNETLPDYLTYNIPPVQNFGATSAAAIANQQPTEGGGASGGGSGSGCGCASSTATQNVARPTITAPLAQSSLTNLKSYVSRVSAPFNIAPAAPASPFTFSSTGVFMGYA